MRELFASPLAGEAASEASGEGVVATNSLIDPLTPTLSREGRGGVRPRQCPYISTGVLTE